MKIQPRGNNVFSSGVVRESEKKIKSSGAGKAANVDKIQISGAPAQSRTTAQLVETLKSQILSDVKSGMDSHKLDELKREVGSGNYDLNLADVVRKMMGDFE